MNKLGMRIMVVFVTGLLTGGATGKSNVVGELLTEKPVCLADLNEPLADGTILFMKKHRKMTGAAVPVKSRKDINKEERELRIFLG